MSVGYLANLANDLLDAAEDALAETSTGHAAPSEAWVNHGEPAADFCCDAGQVTVHLASVDHNPVGLFIGATVAPPQECAITPTANYVVTVFRCHPVPGNSGRPPAPAVQAAAAEALLVDLWAVLTELYDRMYAGTLFPSDGRETICQDVTIGFAEPANPQTQGDCAGWVIPVAVVCNDTGPTGS